MSLHANVVIRKLGRKRGMSLRKGYKDIMEESEIVRVVVDFSGEVREELNLDLSSRKLFIRHNLSGSILEIEMPCEVKEIIKHTFNNGVLDVEIKK